MNPIIIVVFVILFKVSPSDGIDTMVDFISDIFDD